jgi:hypothetical protein
MEKKTPPLIEFRKHVNALISEGAFKAPEDPLIYAIKERQKFEIDHRITCDTQFLDHPNFGQKSWRLTQAHLARIFCREDTLNADDYLYLFSVLTYGARGHLLLQLTANNCDGHDFLAGEQNVWVSRFLQDNDRYAHDPLQVDYADRVFHDAKLLKLLAIHVPDPVQAARAHLEIERTLCQNTRARRFGVELHYLKNAFSTYWEKKTQPTLSFLAAPSVDAADKWIEHYNILLELRKENAKTIVGRTQVNLIENQIKHLRAYDNVDEKLPLIVRKTPAFAEYKRARKDQLERVAQLLRASLHEDIGYLIAELKQSPSKAILAFGKPENKSDGDRVPSAMDRLRDAVTTSRHVDEGQAKKLLELMLVTLLSVNHKNMQPKEITSFISSVKDKVDWAVVVGSLNAKGRAALIDLFPEREYFRAHLSRADRGKVLEQDLGM